MSEVSIELVLKKANNNELIITDKNLRYGFAFRKRNRGVVAYVMISNNMRKIPLPSDFTTTQLAYGLEKVGKELNDDVLIAAANQIAEELMKFYDEWEDLAIYNELRNELSPGEEPVLTINDDGVIFEAYASNGLSIHIHGGFIKLSRKEYAVIETTYAYGRIREEGKRGIRVVEDIQPIMFIAEYRGNELISRKIALPRKRKRKKIEVLGRPVRISTDSVGGSVLPTLMNVRTGKKFIDGELSKDFRTIFTLIKNKIKEFVNMDWDLRLYDVIGVYIISTYFYDVFTAFPRIFLLGPYGVGKTRLGLLIAYCSRHGFPIIDPSDATSYRSIEAYGPTIYIDESSLSDRLVKILAAGYKKGLPVPRIDRTSEGKFIVTLFDTYAPVVFGFTELPREMMLQRCITIIMRKAPDPNPEERDPEPHDLEEIREELYLARLTRVHEVLNTMAIVREDLSNTLEGREFELWCPLLTIAKLCGDDVYENVKSVALEDIERRKEELYSEEKTILAAIEELIRKSNEDEIEFMAQDLQIKIKEILINEGIYDEKRFNKEWGLPRIGAILTRMGIRRKPKGKGKAARYVRKLTIKEFEDLCIKFGYSSQLLEERLKEAKSVGSVRSVGSVSVSESGSTQSPKSVAIDKDSNKTTHSPLPESLQTSQTLQTLTDFVHSFREVKKWGVIDLIKEILRDGPKSDVEIYSELKRAEKSGILKEGIVVIYDTVISALKLLEDQGIITKVFDEREGIEKYVLR